MKACGGGDSGIDPFTFHLSSRCKWVVRFTPHLLCPQRKRPRGTSGRESEHHNRSGRFGDDKFPVSTERRTTVHWSSSP